jgi:hypothetical protein
MRRLCPCSVGNHDLEFDNDGLLGSRFAVSETDSKSHSNQSCPNQPRDRSHGILLVCRSCTWDALDALGEALEYGTGTA